MDKPDDQDVTTERIRALKALIETKDQHIARLERVLGMRNNLGGVFKLTEGMNKLLGLLLENPIVTKEMVQECLGISDNAKMAFNRLRDSLSNHKIAIKNRRGNGWYLDDETKARIREMITPGVTNGDSKHG